MTRSEQRGKELIEQTFLGCTAHKRVDCDFWVVNDFTGDLVIVIEWKGKGDMLRPNQPWFHELLRKQGIRVEVWYEAGDSYRVHDGKEWK